MRDNRPDIAINTDRFLFDFFRSYCVSDVDARIGDVFPFVGHLPERVFDDARGVIAYAQFKKQDVEIFMAAEKVFVSECCLMPPLIFYKSVVCA